MRSASILIAQALLFVDQVRVELLANLLLLA
jgi:hypothetical protein